MNVSFCGISNVQMSLGKQIKKEIGLAPSITGEIVPAERLARDYRLRFDLTNDDEGADFDNLLNAMSKAQKGFTRSYFKDEPNRVEILMRKYMIEDDIGKNYFSVFKINGEDIPILGRHCLDLYSKIANITKRISHMENLSEKQRDFADYMNKSIQQEAINFIETV